MRSRNTGIKPLTSLLLLLGALSVIFAAGTAIGEDTDVYQATVKNNALILIDLSGTMNLPVYDHNIDYTAFLNWAEDPDATNPEQTKICVWQTWNPTGDCYVDPAQTSPFYASYIMPHRIDPSAFPIPEEEQESFDYPSLSKMRWEKDAIYMVSALKGYKEISDNEGNTTYMLLDDYLWGGYDTEGEDPDLSKINSQLFRYGIVDTGWRIRNWEDPSDPDNIIDTEVDAEGKEWVVYPDFPVGESNAWTDRDPIKNNPVYSETEDFGGERFRNHADIQLQNIVTAETGLSRNVGFLGCLRAPGIYFSGLFKEGSTTKHILTANQEEAIAYPDATMTYAFVTGNFLSFVKLVNGLNGNDETTCSYDDSYPSQAWRSVCYQPGETFKESGLNIFSQWSFFEFLWALLRGGDYPDWPYGYTERTLLDPQNSIGLIRVKFEVLDTDACGNDPDFVEFRDSDDNVLLRIKGQNMGCRAEGTPAHAGYQVGDQGTSWTAGTYIDNDTGWTDWFEANTDKIKVFFFNGGDSGCDDGQGDNKTLGFWISGFEYINIPEGAPNYPETVCCNGADGRGYQIQSRIDVAKKAMSNVVDMTRDKINWGLAWYHGSSDTTVYGPQSPDEPFEDADSVIDDVQALTAGGGTPTGEAMELAYNHFNTYLHDDAGEAAACATNYLLLVTDGYPNIDNEWTLINTNVAGNPDFSNTTYQDSDNWMNLQKTGPDLPERADDVAAWMAGNLPAGVKPDYSIITHSIGFNFENPLLKDIAEDGGGINVAAYNRDELINAFYTLGLTMSSTGSFIAPVVSVDEANRTESGDKIYMALFRPLDNDYWQGNLKKFGLDFITRTECGRSEGEWTLVDKNGNVATACDGSILDSAVSYWSSSADGSEVNRGGVGGLLMDAINSVNLGSGPYYSFRNIYTYKSNNLVEFTPDNITQGDLGVSTEEERYSIINFMYGYTYDADGSGSPVARRSWILGDIIHSEPKVIEYFDPDDGLIRRYVAVGANDGMLHVFVDHDSSDSLAEGSEVFAFVPPDMLDNLQNFADTDHFYTVDGTPNLWRGPVQDENSNSTWDSGEYYEKILVFGERRGGCSYWALDVTNPDPTMWNVRWKIEGEGEDFGFMALGQTWNKPQFARIRTGSSSFKDVCIFAGGYDSWEDNYPEPFDDSLVTPNGRWDTGENYTDVAICQDDGGSVDYDPPNGQHDAHNLNGVDRWGRGIYVVDVTDGSHVFSKDRWDTGYSQMRWCFPADPTVIPLSTEKLVIYAPDIYGQIWKVTYTYTDSGNWSAYRIFKANPGSDRETGSTENIPSASDPDDTGRKVFYGPDVSYFGNCWTNYPVLYFGTGDREHPNQSMISNRFYMIKDAFGIGDITEERDLVNLTCNELEDEPVPDLDGDFVTGNDTDDTDIQYELKGLLTTGDARGAYRVLDEQGNCVSGADDHTGEKMLSQPTLFFNNLYFTTYQPVYDDPCASGGNARIYGLDYCWLTSVFDLYSGNSTDRDIRDTYQLINSSSIPSGVRVITRSGEAAGIISVAGAVSGVSEDQGTKVPAPPPGATRFLWETD